MVNAYSLDRRSFLSLSAATAATAVFGTGARAQSDQTIKFWDMMWGSTAYTDAARTITEAFSSDLGRATYQSIPWANFLQTFTSAIAAGSGPAVSSGAGYQALTFYEQGAIAPADNLVAKLKTKDFLPNTIEPLQYDGVYVAVPWQGYVQSFWYRKSLLDEAGVAVPTDWDTLRIACVELQKKGISGFGMAAGPNTTVGSQVVMAMLFNNEGGLFDEDGRPNVVTDRNREVVEFFRELASIGAVSRRYVSYTNQNIEGDFASGRAAMMFYGPGLDTLVPPDIRDDVFVASPLAGPNGRKGTLSAINNLMMYTSTPSQELSEAFLEAYLDGMAVFWQQGLVNGLPVRQSIVDLPEVQANRNLAKIVAEWQPIGIGYSARRTQLFPELNALDGGQAMARFAQRIIIGEDAPDAILGDMQRDVEALF